MKGLEIIEYNPSHLDEIIQLFKNTVHSICKADYTSQQINAWAGGDIDKDAWQENFAESYTIIAVAKGKIVGFSNITDSGYIHMMYVHQDFQKRGIGTALYNDIESYAHSNYFMTLGTHASITAKDFFVSLGFSVVKKQQVIRSGMTLENIVCKKFIGGNYK